MRPGSEEDRRQALLQEAQEAALALCDGLQSRARAREGGLCWETLDPSGEGREVSVRPWLYDGSAGVCLAMAHAYRIGGRLSHGEAAREAARWLLRELHPEDAPWTGLFSGWTGVLFAVLETARCLGDEELRQKAQRLSRELARGVARAQGSDLMEGTTGALVGALLVHEQAPSAELRQTIGRIAHRLIEDIEGVHHGLFWGASSRQVRPLAGLAHGAAGIAHAWALHEAQGGGEGSAWLRDLALSYEDALPRGPAGEWPDLRLELWTPEDMEAAIARLERGDLTWFTQPSFTQAWCHGGGGTGLMRLHLGLYSGRTSLQQDAVRAAMHLRGCRRVEEQEWCLCHGLAGDLELFDEIDHAALHPEAGAWRDEALRQLCQAARRGLELPSGYNLTPRAPCASLFLGSAGVAYALLRCVDPDTTPSVLLPGAPLRRRGAVDAWSVRRVRGLVLGQLLPRASGALAAERLQGREFEEPPALEETSDTLENLWTSHLGARGSRGKARDVARWEMRWRHLDGRLKSRGLVAVREAWRKRLLRSWHEEGSGLSPEQRLFADPELVRVTAAEARCAGLDVPERAQEVALVPGKTPGGEIFLGVAEVALLDSFSPEGLVSEVLGELLDGYPEGQGRDRARGTLEARIKALLTAGLLWRRSPPALLE
jgi:hypothetical protein